MEVDPEGDSDHGSGQCDDRVVGWSKFKLEEGSSALFTRESPRLQCLGQLKTSPIRDQQQWKKNGELIRNSLNQIPFFKFHPSEPSAITTHLASTAKGGTK